MAKGHRKQPHRRIDTRLPNAEQTVRAEMSGREHQRYHRLGTISPNVPSSSERPGQPIGLAALEFVTLAHDTLDAAWAYGLLAGGVLLLVLVAVLVARGRRPRVDR